MNRQILIGDVMEKIKEIPDETVDLMITSPPYLWLRDYGFEGQWGLEETIDDYLDKMINFMSEVKRVIKKTGSAVVNMGDTYGGGSIHSDWSWNDPEKSKYVYSPHRRKDMQFKKTGIRKPHPQSLLFIPWQFGWRCVDELDLTCHNIIPWIKGNAMPFSGSNRFTNKWEPVLWFTKIPSGYYFDLDAIRQRPSCWDEKSPKRKDTTGQTKLTEGNEIKASKQDQYPTASGTVDPTKEGFNERWKNRKRQEQSLLRKNNHNYDSETGEYLGNPLGKNPGDVLYINPRPYPDAHYATFPVDLPEYYISCMCPADGLVLDPFAGSGTTAEAAEKLARKWVLIEAFPGNLKLIQKRLKPYLSGKLTEYAKTTGN